MLCLHDEFLIHEKFVKYKLNPKTYVEILYRQIFAFLYAGAESIQGHLHSESVPCIKLK